MQCNNQMYTNHPIIPPPHTNIDQYCTCMQLLFITNNHDATQGQSEYRSLHCIICSEQGINNGEIYIGCLQERNCLFDIQLRYHSVHMIQYQRKLYGMYVDGTKNYNNSNQLHSSHQMLYITNMNCTTTRFTIV